MAVWRSAKPRSVPRVAVDVEGAAKHSSPGMTEHAPGGDHVDGGITDPHTAEGDDRRVIASRVPGVKLPQWLAPEPEAPRRQDLPGVA